MQPQRADRGHEQAREPRIKREPNGDTGRAREADIQANAAQSQTHSTQHAQVIARQIRDQLAKPPSERSESGGRRGHEHRGGNSGGAGGMSARRGSAP